MKEHYRGLGHVAVLTRDMEQSIAFYEKIGGMLQQRGQIDTREGPKLLALVAFGGITLELIQPPVPPEQSAGVIPHFAIYVDDLDAVAQALREAGVDSFQQPQKTVRTDLFGGLQNWFFTGPSGEQIELLQML